MAWPARRAGTEDGRRDDVQRAAVAAVLVLVSVVAALWLLLLVRELLASALLGIVLGTTLAPAVDRMARYRIPRLLTGAIIYALIAGALTLFFWYAIPELIQEARGLGERWDDIEADYNEFADGSFLPDSEGVLEFVRENLLAGLGPEAVSQAFAVLGGLISLLTVLAVGLFWTVSRHSAQDLFLSLLTPAQREEAARVLDTLGTRLRRFVVAELVGMLVVGVLTYIGLTILGVEFALVLAVIAFVLEILPFVGPWIAYAPALAVALTESWELAIAVSILYLAINQLEAYVIVPVIHGRGTNMPEMVIFLAVLAGAALMGILGALVAIPVAVIVHTLFMEVYVPRRQRQVEEASPKLVPKAVKEERVSVRPPVQGD